MSFKTNRRKFLKTAAAGATSALILGQSKSALSFEANEKLNVALIGVGNQGRGYIGKMARINQNLVALCDCDEQRIQDAGANPDLPKDIKVYSDFRKLLDEMDKQIDAVIIATPHHNQPAMAAAAMKRGKHVYCEKPIGHDVGEARSMRELANKYKVVTQMGNQGVATDSFRRILEQVQDGRVGEIKEAHQWFVQDPMGGGPNNQRPAPAPADATAIPAGFNWDLFLGPAKMRPYDFKYMRWSNWRDFGTGMLGMGASHSCPMSFRSLNLRALWDGNGGAPVNIRVSSECSDPGGEKFSSWEVVKFDFPARGSMPAARINWYKGPKEDLERMGIWSNMEKIAGRSLDWGKGWAQTSGSLLVGSKGVVHTNMHNSECALLPENDFKDQGGPPQKLPHSGSHDREWATACRGGALPFSNFDTAGPMIELMLLGNISTLLNRPIEFDPVACKIVNDEEANRALRPPRREGWEM